MHLSKQKITQSFMAALSKRMTVFILLLLFVVPVSYAKPPNKNTKSKFYDFNEQVIDGEIRKPTVLYTNARERAKFERLLRLKKSFLPMLFRTSKNKVFK